VLPPAGETEDICSCSTGGKDLSREKRRWDSEEVFLEEGEGVLLQCSSEGFSGKVNLHVCVGEGDEVVGKECGGGGATYMGRGGGGEIDATGALWNIPGNDILSQGTSLGLLLTSHESIVP